MSRCHPFPPPGYVKSPPVDLDLLSKKEKHKHKEKKKKRKKQSTTSDDLTAKGLPDGDRDCADVSQPGQSYIGLSLTKVNLGVIKGPQTQSFIHEAFSNHDLATDLGREVRLRVEEDSRPRSMLSAELFEGHNSGHHRPFSKSGSCTDYCESFRGINPAMEEFQDSCTATANKRLKLESSTSLANSAPMVPGYYRPEQAENFESLNGVLSTKRKRLQAENSVFLAGDNSLLPKGVLTCKESFALQTGRSSANVLMQARTDSTALLAEYSKNASIPNNGFPTGLTRSEKRLREDQLRSRGGTGRPFSNICQVENGKGRDVPHSLLVNRQVFETDKFKGEMPLNSVKTTSYGQIQTSRSNFQKRPNGVLTIDCHKPLQSEKISMMNSLRDFNMSGAPANKLNQVCSGATTARMLEESERQVQDTTNRSTVSNAKDLLLELNCTKQEVSSQNAQTTSEERVNINTCERDMKMPVTEAENDETCNRHAMLAISYGHNDPRLQVDDLENKITSNGVLTCNEQSELGNILCTPPSAANGNNSEAKRKTTHSPTVALNYEDTAMKEKLSNVGILQPEQAWVTNAESEDWLVSSKQELQLKERGKGKEGDLQQVWADAVLLREVGLTALPFVVLN